MTRARILLAVEALALLASWGIALALPAGVVNRTSAVWFLIGLLVLTFSDVWLPGGDAFGMSSALVLAAILWFDARVVLGMLLAAEILALLPHGRSRVWRSSVGFLAVQSFAAAVCSAALVASPFHPLGAFLRSVNSHLPPLQYAYVLAVGLAFAVLEFALTQLDWAARTARPFGASLLAGFWFDVWLLAAQVSSGVLAALMYRTTGAWGLAVAVLMILVMRQAFVLLIQIREAYSTTIDVLIKAMEAQDPAWEGVAEANAKLSLLVGRRIGMHGRDLERLRYAALLVGMGFSEETDLLASKGDRQQTDFGDSARIVEDVEFLKDILPILRLCDSPLDRSPATRSELTTAYLVTAVGVATGTVSSGRLALLRERVSPRVVGEVDRFVAHAVVSAERGSPAQAV
jgi:hypothetical protein